MDGVCCEDAECAPGGDTCDNHQCMCGNGAACAGSTPDCCGDPGSCITTETDPANCGACDVVCDAGLACCGGACVDLQTDAGFCGSCDIACGANQICVDGACQTCDVTCTGDAAACGVALTAALSGSQATLYVCPGTYAGGFDIDRALTVIGAGQGDDPARDTILDGGGTQRVLEVSGDTVALHRLRVTHGDVGIGAGGGILHQGGALTMQDCTVTANRGVTGGGIAHGSGTLTMTRCTVSDNTAPNSPVLTGIGGGLSCASSMTLTDCQISGNSTDGFGGGIYAVSRAIVILAGEPLIQGNTAAARGGGIFSIVDFPGSITIGEDCRITGNMGATGPGGGIYRHQGTGPVTLQGTDDLSPIVTDNCHENCVGDVPKCAPTPVFCPA